MIKEKIWTTADKKEERFLHKKAEPFDFSEWKRGDIAILIRAMRSAMRKAKGIGLAANQVGLPYSVFVAEIPSKDGGKKFYSFFNPKIERMDGEHLLLEEGCLSGPGVYGLVERRERVLLSAFDKSGKAVKLKAWGLLAHVFQHETDHLNGMLFIEKVKHIIDQETYKEKRANR